MGVFHDEIIKKPQWAEIYQFYEAQQRETHKETEETAAVGCKIDWAVQLVSFIGYKLCLLEKYNQTTEPAFTQIEAQAWDHRVQIFGIL